MKTITSSQIQRKFSQLFPIPNEGYKITRDHIVVAYLFPADLAINVSRGIEIDVDTTERARGRCQECGVQNVLFQISKTDTPKYLCERCIDARET